LAKQQRKTAKSTAPELPWRASQLSRNVFEVRIPHRQTKDWEFWTLLASDHHWDNPKSRHDLILAHLNEAVERKAAAILPGDVLCLMQGRYDPRSSKSSVRPEHQVDNYLDAVISTAADFFRPYAQNIVCIGTGNHECVDPETEVATSNGWKNIADVTVDDSVMSLHPHTQQVQFCRPIKTHRCYYNGDMVHAKHRSIDMMLTPNHRVAYLKQNSKELTFVEAKHLIRSKGQALLIPTNGEMERDEYPLTDNQIRLAAWFITDGSVGSRSIYQSKPKMIEHIRSLLSEMGITYSETIRSSKRNTHICGVKLLKEPLPSHVFRILQPSAAVFDALGVTTKKHLPSWAFHLSKRQFDLLLREIILGDGTRRHDCETSMMVYGTRELLESLQLACVMNGYRASITQRYRRGNPAYVILNVVERASLTLSSRHAQLVPYSGFVYCLTMPSGNFFARRNGRVFVTGNSAIAKRLESHPTERLIGLINAHSGASVYNGGFSGFVRFAFTQSRSTRNHPVIQTTTLHYDHGYGGGGPVTKDMIQHQRRAVYLPDAEIVCSGHVHEAWTSETARKRLTKSGRVYHDIQTHIKLPTYKEEYEDGFAGWHVETGKAPRPLGAWWLRFYWCGRNDKVLYEVIRAK
jgi:hypothetical protein